MAKERLFYIDNLKVLLIFLVVAHHAGQVYGSTGGFWPAVVSQPGTIPWMGRFFSVNASFFMGLFFMISGYFFAPSFERKGFWKYTKDKIIRYGIPLAFTYWILMPPGLYLFYLKASGNPPIGYLEYIWKIYLGLDGQPEWFKPVIGWPEGTFGFGHLWFVEHLLIYALLYGVARQLLKGFTIPSPKSLNAYGYISLLIVIVSAATILVRQTYPIDRWVDIFGFIISEVAHLPQYMAFMLTGIIAWETRLFSNFPKSFGLTVFIAGLAMAGMIYGSPLLPERLRDLIWGNFEIYETMMSVFLSFGFLVFFREFINFSNGFLKMLSANAYGAYIIHAPVVVGLQYAFDQVEFNMVLKFLVVTVLSIFISFGLTYIVRLSSAVRKVL